MDILWEQVAAARNGGAPSPWFVVQRPVVRPRARLVCLPYAGGAATVFHHWWKGLPADVEVLSVQPPGRGTRFREPACTRMADLVAGLRSALLPLTDRPYVVFGHSMGAVAAFELMRSLPRAAQPAHFFASGRGAPHLAPVQRTMHRLGDAELVDELRRMNGTPEQVLRDPGMLALILPTIRADFTALENWAYEPGAPLDVDITAFGGSDDMLVPYDRLIGWGAHTRGFFEARLMPGGHFFLHSCPERLLEIIADRFAGL